jgi:hypothetical protein
MSEQAEKFLAQWEIAHIKVVARSNREDQARRLALRCREDAARAGINSQDLEAAAEGNLIANMLIQELAIGARDFAPAATNAFRSRMASKRSTGAL